jgi:hypothetical protein
MLARILQLNRRKKKNNNNIINNKQQHTTYNNMDILFNTYPLLLLPLIYLLKVEICTQHGLVAVLNNGK